MPTCQEAQTEYAAIQALKDNFRAELDQAAKSGDFRKAKELKQELETRLAKLWEMTDRWQYKLRDRIAKEKGYEVVSHFNRFGIAVAEQRHQDGNNFSDFFIDRSGNKITDEFNMILKPSEGIFCCYDKTERVFILIDETGRKITSETFSNVGDFSEGKAWVLRRNESNWSIFDLKTKTLIPTELDHQHYSPQRFAEGLTRIMQIPLVGGDLIFADETGKQVGPKYKEATDFSEGLAFVKPVGEDRGHYINKNGRDVGLGHFAEGSAFSEGFASVVVEAGPPKVFMYIDKNGNQALNGKLFLKAGPFENGTAVVTQANGRQDIIDKNGNGLAGAPPPGFKEIQCNFIDGVAIATLEHDLDLTNSNPNPELYDYLIDKNGTALASRWAQIFKPSDRLCRARKWGSGKYYYLNLKGTIAFDTEFDEAADFHDGVAEVTKDGETYYIDRKGRRIFSEEPASSPNP